MEAHAFVAVFLALGCLGPCQGLDVALHEPPLKPLAPAGVQAAPLEVEAWALAERFAPVYLQHVSSEHPERDRPLAIDFDGDWDSTNNWSHLKKGASKAPLAVYASSILTSTHAYLTYTLFYPRDWTSLPCVPYACHDNDLEVALLVVERNASGGELVLVETKTHSWYVAREGAQTARDPAGRPLLDVETEGHGIHPVEVPFAREGDVVALAPAGGTRASGSVEYELLSLHDTLWARRRNEAGGARLWSADAEWYAGTRLGARGYAFGTSFAWRVFGGAARPPWGLAADGPRGDWFLDPAFVTQERHGAWFRRPASQAYAWNPYLDDLSRECSGGRCSRPARAATLDGATDTGSLSVLGLALLAVGKRRSAARRSPRSREERDGRGPSPSIISDR